MAKPQDPLFVYGTLMAPAVLAALLGRVPERKSAVLHGYRRYAVKGACYPAIISDAHAAVHGLMFLDLTPEENRILDAYEGEEYVRTAVRLRVEGADVVANCYVWQHHLAERLAPVDWDLNEFTNQRLASYLQAIRANNDAGPNHSA